MNGFLGGLMVGGIGAAAAMWFGYAAPLATKQEDTQAQSVAAQQATTTAKVAQREAEANLAAAIADESSTKAALEKQLQDAREASERQIGALREQLAVAAQKAIPMNQGPVVPDVAPVAPRIAQVSVPAPQPKPIESTVDAPKINPDLVALQKKLVEIQKRHDHWYSIPQRGNIPDDISSATITALQTQIAAIQGMGN